MRWACGKVYLGVRASMFICVVIYLFKNVYFYTHACVHVCIHAHFCVCPFILFHAYSD